MATKWTIGVRFMQGPPAYEETFLFCRNGLIVAAQIQHHWVLRENFQFARVYMGLVCLQFPLRQIRMIGSAKY
jgi:hypothetical protein